MNTLRIRPFRRPVEVGQPPTALIVQGEIERESFVLVTLGQKFRVPIVDAASDEQGRYVLVNEGEYESPDRARLTIKHEYDEEFGIGAEVIFSFGGAHRAALINVLRERGIDPDSVLLLAPSSGRGLSVYFDSDGNVNGTGSMGSPIQPARGA